MLLTFLIELLQHPRDDIGCMIQVSFEASIDEAAKKVEENCRSHFPHFLVLMRRQCLEEVPFVLEELVLGDEDSSQDEVPACCL